VTAVPDINALSLNCRLRASGVEIGMLRRRFASASLVASFLIAGLCAARAGELRAVLELFTSQGCSSCPDADKLLGELASDPALVPLSLPIDYWDYLGWKDTLALSGHSTRQRAYARLRGDRDVYTPQVVVNGSVHALGSDRDAIEHAIVQTDRNAMIMSVPVVMSVDGGILNVRIAAAEKERIGGEVWLCPVAKTVPVQIGRGENHGRTITYHNVVRRWLKLGDWAGSAAAWSIPLANFKSEDIDTAAIILQEGTKEKPGIVLGAAMIPIGSDAPESR
jgi:hypothetical protein